MKKIILIIMLLLASQVNASMIIQSPTATSDCPVDTYLFYWDGDHSSGPYYACINSGASTKNGTASSITVSAVGYSGNGVTIDDGTSYLEWAISAEDIIDNDEGTIWVRVYWASSPSSACQLWEANEGGSDWISSFTHNTDITYGSYASTGQGGINVQSDSTVTTGSWTTIAYAWDNANDDHSVNNDGSWDDDLNAGIVGDMPVPTVFWIGDSGGAGACTPNPIVDEVYIFSTYKVASPY